MQVAFCELRVSFFTSWKFKEIILQVASCISWVENFKNLFYQLPVTSWNFKMIMFTSCEVAFYKLKLYHTNFTNYHHMAESNFKGINLHKLCGKAILTEWILTLDKLNTHCSNAIKTVIRTFDLSNSSSYRNPLAILYNYCFMYHNDHLVHFIVWVIKSKF